MDFISRDAGRESIAIKTPRQVPGFVGTPSWEKTEKLLKQHRYNCSLNNHIWSDCFCMYNHRSDCVSRTSGNSCSSTGCSPISTGRWEVINSEKPNWKPHQHRGGGSANGVQSRRRGAGGAKWELRAQCNMHSTHWIIWQRLRNARTRCLQSLRFHQMSQLVNLKANLLKMEHKRSLLQMLTVKYGATVKIRSQPPVVLLFN